MHPLTRTLRRLATVGAVAPSSRALSKVMAEHAVGAQLLIELGAGTGPITRALQERFPSTPLISVELQAALAHRLAQHFPNVHVEARPAAAVLDGLAPEPSAMVVVSALPFRSLPKDIHEDTVLALVRVLEVSAERRLVQFTYQPRAPFDVSRWPHLRWVKVATVWRNAPPASVWRLQLTSRDKTTS